MMLFNFDLVYGLSESSVRPAIQGQLHTNGHLEIPRIWAPDEARVLPQSKRVPRS